MLVIAQKLNKYARFYETRNNMTIFQEHDADQYPGPDGTMPIPLLHLSHTIQFCTPSKVTSELFH